MAITYVGSGAGIIGLNTALSPTPPSYQTGDALIYITGEHFGTDSQTAPSGWAQLSANSTVTEVTIWGRIAQSASETIPTVNWGATNRGWAFISVFRGVDTSFTSLMPGTAERTGNTTGNIIGPAASKTPTQDGALAILAGGWTKTSATDGATYSAPSGWSGMLQQVSQTGSSNAMTGAAAYLIQTTATAVPANTGMAISINGTSSTMNGTMIFLAPAASGGGGGGGTGTVTFPPPKRKTYVFYDLYYPR